MRQLSPLCHLTTLFLEPPPDWSFARFTHSAVASSDAPDGVFFGKDLRFEGAVAKTLKSEFLRRAEIRTLLK